MNKNYYATLEIAKILKRKGYNEKTINSFCSSKDLTFTSNLTNSELPVNVYSKPSLCEIERWIRKNYNIKVDIETKYNPLVHKFEYTFIYTLLSKKQVKKIKGFISWDEAYSKGLLNLLKNI